MKLSAYEFEQRLEGLITSPGMDGLSLKKLSKKVVGVLKKALPVVGLVANFVPGIGTAASLAIKAATMAVKMRDAHIDAKRAERQARQAEAEALAAGDAQVAELARIEAENAAQVVAQTQANMEAAKFVQGAADSGLIKGRVTGEQVQQLMVNQVLESQGVNTDTPQAQAFSADVVETVNDVVPNANDAGVDGLFDNPIPTWVKVGAGLGVIYLLTRKR